VGGGAAAVRVGRARQVARRRSIPRTMHRSRATATILTAISLVASAAASCRAVRSDRPFAAVDRPRSWSSVVALTRTLAWCRYMPNQVGQHPRQLELVIRTWGGHRAGAGRKTTAGRRTGVPHLRRAPHEARYPAHATLRMRSGLPSLRGARIFAAVRRALSAASHERFRVLHFSVQTDHLHLLVEADGTTALSRGLSRARNPRGEGR